MRENIRRYSSQSIEAQNAQSSNIQQADPTDDNFNAINITYNSNSNIFLPIEPQEIYLENTSENTQIMASKIFSSFIFRHNLSKKCAKELIELIKLFKGYDLNDIHLLPNARIFNELIFCDCFISFPLSSRNYMCNTCNTKPNNFLTINNYLERASEICKNYFNLASGMFECEFYIFIDGISISNNSISSLWPIMMVFNKIPYENKYKIENVCIVGIYFGRLNPNLINNLLSTIQANDMNL